MKKQIITITLIAAGLLVGSCAGWAVAYRYYVRHFLQTVETSESMQTRVTEADNYYRKTLFLTTKTTLDLLKAKEFDRAIERLEFEYRLLTNEIHVLEAEEAKPPSSTGNEQPQQGS